MGHTWRQCSFVNFTAWSTVLTSHGSKLYHFTLSTQFFFINTLILMTKAKRITQTSFVLFCWCCASFTFNIGFTTQPCSYIIQVIPKLIKLKKAFFTVDRKGPLIVTWIHIYISNQNTASKNPNMISCNGLFMYPYF